MAGSVSASLDPDRYVDTETVADLLSLSPSYLRQLRVKGGGPRYSRLSARAVRYRVSDALAWASAASARSTSEYEVANAAS